MESRGVFGEVIGTVSVMMGRDFPGSTVDKNSSATARDTGLIPGSGRSNVPCSN